MPSTTIESRGRIVVHPTKTDSSVVPMTGDLLVRIYTRIVEQVSERMTKSHEYSHMSHPIFLASEPVPEILTVHRTCFVLETTTTRTCPLPPHMLGSGSIHAPLTLNMLTNHTALILRRRAQPNDTTSSSPQFAITPAS